MIKKEDTFQQIGWKGEGYIKWEAKGFRSETVDLHIKRNDRWSDSKHEWRYDIEIPRWGREYEEHSDIETHEHIYRVYGEALAKLKEYQSREAELEAEFQKGEAHRQAEKDRQAAELQAKIDADKPVGVKLAKTICDNMVKQARATEQDSKEIVFQTRGHHEEVKMRCVYTMSGLTLFNCGWNRIARKDAVRKLADAWINSVDTGDIKDDIPDARLAKFMMGGVAKQPQTPLLVGSNQGLTYWTEMLYYMYSKNKGAIRYEGI